MTPRTHPWAETSVLMTIPCLCQHPRASEVNRCSGNKINGLKTSHQKAWSGVTKPKFDLGRASQETEHSPCPGFTHLYFEEGRDEVGIRGGTASKGFVSAISSLWLPGNIFQRGSCSTNNKWMGRGTPELKPKCHNTKQYLSTAVVKQCSHPACKLTRGKATAATLQGYL